MDTKAKVLDIAMNLNRIGNWAADGYAKKEKRIAVFLNETSQLIKSIKKTTLPNNFSKTFKLFLTEYEKLKKQTHPYPKDEIGWAEIMMTWGNILTHRSQLI